MTDFAAPEITSLTPTADEMDRVTRHWDRVNALMCTHEELIFENSSLPVCTECHKTIYFLSDIQIKEKRDANE